MKRPAFSSPRSRAFTLLEIALVLAITGVLVLMASYAFSAAMQASAVASGADSIRDTLALGRASAVAQNMAVEVRFYATSTSSGGAPLYNAMQLHWIKTDGATPAVGPVVSLSSWAVLDSSSTYSTLIASATNQQTPTPDASDRLLDGNTRVFHYLADGSTDLSPSSTWSLTVRPASTAGATQLPANWACIVVDPASGRPQIYRP